MLHSFGIPKEDIWIGVHDEEAKKEYEKDIGEFATVINLNVFTLGQKRSKLLSLAEPGQKVLIMDDDIQGIVYVTESGEAKSIETSEEFISLLDYCFAFTKKASSVLWGTYPVNNPFFMSYSIDLNNLLICTCMGIVAGTFNFNPDSVAKEDMELCLRMMQSGMNVVRFNFIVADAKHRTKGGAYDDWKSGRNEKATLELAKKYPQFVKYTRQNASHLKFLNLIKYKGKIEWDPKNAR